MRPVAPAQARPDSAPGIAAIGEGDFEAVRRFIRGAAGVELGLTKKPLVVARLGRRLRVMGLRSFGDYVRLLDQPDHAAERETAIDLLTTHETYFFREPAHLEYLRDTVLPGVGAEGLAVWSAACSTGEEVYSIAMVLSDRLGRRPWSVLGTDVSERVLEVARAGHYAENRIDAMPADYLRRFCLRGRGPQAGTLLVDRALRDRVEFRQLNLVRPFPPVGPFDVVFLRNVLIYFDRATQRDIARQIARRMTPGGHLFIGHSESIKDAVPGLRSLAPAVYRLEPEGRAR